MQRFLSYVTIAVFLLSFTAQPAAAASPTYDITTLAGKVASLNGTAGLQIRFSAFIEQEAHCHGFLIDWTAHDRRQFDTVYVNADQHLVDNAAPDQLRTGILNNPV